MGLIGKCYRTALYTGCRPTSAGRLIRVQKIVDQSFGSNWHSATSQSKCPPSEEDLSILRQNTVAKQEPFAAVLSCADLRVPVELVFDEAIGRIFVTRVAGNICTPEIIASLEYGAAVLGTVSIPVLGHDGCGAVQAAIAGKALPGQVSALYAPLRPAVERAGPDLVAATQANARIQADLLVTASPVLAELISQGHLKVLAAYYSLGDGAVTLLD